MTGRDNIDYGRVADWIEGRLSEEEAGAVEQQVARADEETREEVAVLRAFIEASGHTALEKPPPSVRETLAHRFENHARGLQEPGLFRRLVATLAPGGGLQPAGARSAGGGETQGQLIYTTEAADVVLNLRPRPGDGELDLDGQVFPAGEAEPDSFGVQLLSGADEVDIAATDELGEFAFEAVPPGEYQLIVSGEEVEILISPVELRA